MEVWLLLIVSICLSALLKPLVNLFFPSSRPTHNLPPGPFSLPIIGNFSFLRISASEFEPLLHSLHAKLGPIITLRIGTSRPYISIADPSLAHQALIQNGAVFACRAPASATARIRTCNQRTVHSAFYGTTWRLLRRNLTSEIFHPSRSKSLAQARHWVLQILKNRLVSKSGDPVRVIEHFHYAMYCLLVSMCFGENFDEKKVQEIELGERNMLSTLKKFRVLDFSERLTKIFLRKRWAEFFRLLQDRTDVALPLIRARKKLKEERLRRSTSEYKEEDVICYVDTLLDLEMPDEKRKLKEDEIVALCSEFLVAGTDTTSTSLQWIMANLVKYPHIQQKLLMEIKGVVGNEKEHITEKDLERIPYLKAIVLEGLRRHPPGPFLVPHAVREDVVLGGYLIPKNATINFMVAGIGRDPKAWEDPMEFKPERFLKEGAEAFDIKGSREIKMMPFGAGRRICPANGFAMALLEYFVANLVWSLEWKAVGGDDVDLSEKLELTCTMKNPLQAHISPRLQI